MEFKCVRCNEEKKAKLVAVSNGDWSKLHCNGCYGYLLSKVKGESYGESDGD